VTDVGEPRRLRDLPLRRTYELDDRPRDTFYVPCLRVAARYDRFAGYFRAASLEAVADEGLQPFVQRDGLIRIVVDADLLESDVQQIRRGGEVGGDQALREAVRSQVHAAVLRAELPASDRLSLVATLVAAGQMKVKVAVMEGSDGVPLPPGHPMRSVFHDKVGIFWDEEHEAVAFRGSLNETPSGWARNYEGFSVYPMWDAAVWDAYGSAQAERFEKAWGTGKAGAWRLFDLPDPAVEKLIQYADPNRDWHSVDFADPGPFVVDPHSPPTSEVIVVAEPQREEAPFGDDLAALRAAEWAGIRTATVTPWPHQDAAAKAVVSALWPRDATPGEFGRMFADEVGLGKTIEIGLVIREALSNRGARRVCVLAPASVAPQWQGELWDKFTLWMPLLVGQSLRWPDGSTTPAGDNPWRSSDLVIASSHLARMTSHQERVLDAGWDLLVIDEAHHARRAESSKPGTANKMLRLLRAAANTPAIKRLLLATATPMQMHVHEAWELLACLGLPDIWTASAFERYWNNLAADQPHNERDWAHLHELYAATAERWGIDTIILPALRERAGFVDAHAIEHWHDSPNPGGAKSWPRAKADTLTWWLSEQTPLRHLVYRSSRELLRHYQDVGIIAKDVVIPERDPDDLVVDLELPGERDLYDRIETWISKHYQAAKDAKKPAHGFVMTVYRRRLTSSLHAIRVSLQRRAEALQLRRDDAEAVLDLGALLDEDDLTVLWDSDETEITVDPRALDEVAGLEDELAEVADFVAAIDKVLEANNGKDSKYDRFEALLRQTVIAGRHRTCIVFTQYTDTMEWLRQHLASALGSEKIACYSGGGGELPAGDGTWRSASKTDVTTAFRDAATNPDNELRILLGTDSMSEGLNLQTCDLLINYDLPWNFMRLEQRIGRIDRIGGPEIAHVRNLLIRDSVEERVYSGIVNDHSAFGTVIGPTGKVTGDPTVVLNSTEHLIAACSLQGGDVDSALEELRRAAQEARSKALTAGTFDNSTLEGHDPEEGPWRFDRGDMLQRLAHVLSDLLPDAATDPIGPWKVDTTDGAALLTLDPNTAADTEAALAVWGHPVVDKMRGDA